MDARKIQFLIGLQREINKLEAKEGNVPKVEKIKSRFYDVVEVEEMVGKPKTEVSLPKDDKDVVEPVVGDGIDITSFSEYDDLVDLVDGLSEGDFLSPEKAEELVKNRVSRTIDVGTNVQEGVIIPYNIDAKKIKKKLILLEQEPINKPEKPFPHKPKDIVDFMKLFDDASSLKYLTHDFDEVDQKFAIRNFLNEAKKIFNQYTHKFTIPASLWTIINQFAFHENPQWFAVGKEIKEGWSSKEWIQWSEINGYPSKNLHFENVIKEFKEQVRVRSLPKIINNVIEKKFGGQQKRFNFNFVELEKADFYTHVDSFIAGLEHLFDEISSRRDFPNVTIKLERTTDGEYRHRIIHIYHHDSYPLNKSVEEVFEKYQKSGGNLWEARKKLFGYCDWFIETIWDDQPMRIYLLREGMVRNKVDVEIEKLDSLVRTGFTHTLTFYTR